ncbi:MAG: YqhA family protein [Methyloceanibacter sp.]
MTPASSTLLSFLLGLRAIMLIGSAGAMVGALLMFLQGGRYLYHAWHEFFSGAQVIVPVLEAVDAFLFGIVLVIFAYGIAMGFVFTLPEGYGKSLPQWMKVAGVGQLKQTLAEVVIVVLIVIFARVVVGTVDSSKPFEWPMLVLPGSILLIALALRMIELGGAKGGPEGGGH